MGLSRRGAVVEAEVGLTTLPQIRFKGWWLQGTVALWGLLASPCRLSILATVPEAVIYHKEEAADTEGVDRDILTR